MKFKIVLLSLLVIASSGFAQSKKFVINGIVDTSFKSSKVYFTRAKMFATEQAKPEAINITNGKFTVQGTLTEPEQAFFSSGTDLRARENIYAVLLDAGTISVTLKGDIKASVAKGSKANEDFLRYVNKNKEQNTEFSDFVKNLQQAATSGKNMDSLKTLFQEKYARFQTSERDSKFTFIKENPKAFISLALVKELADASNDYNQADSLFKSLSSEVKNTPSGKTFAAQISNQKKLSVGAVAPDFTQNDVNGKAVSLKDFRGKYVLIDFWASWCGPCRQENPNVVEAYNRYKEKNFTVLGISLDRADSRNAWLKAIDDDRLSWTQVSDLKFWQNEVAQMYNIRSIPQNFLLDPNGKIIARNLRGEELKAYLADLFEKGKASE